MKLIDIVITLETMYNDVEYGGEILDSALIQSARAIASLRNLSLKEEDYINIIREFKSRNPIKVYDGIILLDNYEHKEWYKKGTNEKFFNDYIKYLKYEKKFKQNIVENLENDFINKLMNCLGDPNEKSGFFRRGLVIGDVQSGKTSAYTGLICKAADVGYKVIILLTGQTEILRSQTQKRIDEGFIGIDTKSKSDEIEILKSVGVGKYRDEVLVNSFTSVNEDFVGNKNNIIMTLSEKKPNVFIIKKNSTVLQRLYKWLLIYNSNKINKKIDLPALIIDDEADNDSINTNKIENDPTVINKSIRKLSKLFNKSNYIGITATPFANVFINPKKDDDFEEDLFPENFIFLLNPPSHYIGPDRIFGENSEFSDNLKVITKIDKEIYNLDHKKDWKPIDLDKSLKEAFRSFIIASTIRKLRNGESNMSMLVNMSRFISVQFHIKKLLIDELSKVKNEVLIYSKSQVESSVLKDLKNLYNQEFNKSGFTWNQVKKTLIEIVTGIDIKIVNSSKNSDKLEYDENSPRRVIAVGGLALSRGLTLEGLSTSYFLRNTKTYDVLMQMGRFFGYRIGYEDLFKIYLSKKSKEWFEGITKGIKELKNEIKVMNESNMTPKDFGLKVKLVSDELEITASNKMRRAKKQIKYISYFGGFFETPFVYTSDIINNSNLNVIKTLADKIGLSKRDIFNDYTLKNVNKNIIIDFLANIKIPINNNKFHTVQLLDFISQSNHIELEYWDVAFVESGRSNKINIGTLEVRPVERSFSIKENDVVSILGNKARLGGPTDFILGIKPFSKDKNNTTSESFLLEGRRPILLIYPVRLVRPKDDSNLKKENDLINKVIFGFSIGFPKKHGVELKSEEFYVNVIYQEKLNVDLEEE